jgi:enediyne biosynthesis protein E4
VRAVRNVGYAQAPQFFLNNGKGSFQEVGAEAGGGFNSPKVGRGLAIGDFDGDGDQDILMTTNNGPAFLFRNDQAGGNRSIRFHLMGTKSNRDAIGARIKLFVSGTMQTRMVRSGSSYLSQSELPVTFGVGKQDKIDRIVIDWPSGRSEEFKNLASEGGYDVIEAKGIKTRDGF